MRSPGRNISRGISSSRRTTASPPAAAEIDDDVAVFDALDLAVDDFADAVLEHFILLVALGLANLLHQHLLGGLGGDAADSRTAAATSAIQSPICAEGFFFCASASVIWVASFST